jgi:hypothetical protein
MYSNLIGGGPTLSVFLRIVVALLFLQHGLSKFFGFPEGAASRRFDPSSDHRNRGQPATTGRLVHASGGVRYVGRNGLCLLYHARAEVLLPGGQWRNFGRSLLLRVSLSRLRGRRTLEHRPRRAEAGLALSRAKAR